MRCDTGPTPDRLKVRIMRDNAKCVGSSSDQAFVEVSLESYSAHPNFQRMAHSTSGRLPADVCSELHRPAGKFDVPTWRP
jgi:hypothetical protein